MDAVLFGNEAVIMPQMVFPKRRNSTRRESASYLRTWTHILHRFCPSLSANALGAPQVATSCRLMRSPTDIELGVQVTYATGERSVRL